MYSDQSQYYNNVQIIILEKKFKNELSILENKYRRAFENLIILNFVMFLLTLINIYLNI